MSWLLLRLHCMTFAQRRNRLTTHFSELIPVVKRRISVYVHSNVYSIFKHHMYLLRTSFLRPILLTAVCNFSYFILIIVLPFNWNFNQNNIIFNCGMILTYKYICILDLTTLKVTTAVVQTCQWSLRNKITFLYPSESAGLF
jgi:hypothetical protein